MKPAPRCVAALLCLAGCGDEGAAELPVVDVEPPTFPAGAELRASAPGRRDATARTAELRWPEAHDDVGVVAYVLRVDGEEAARRSAGEAHAPSVGVTREDDTLLGRVEGVTFEAARTFAVVAVDGAGNESAPLEAGDALAPFWPEGAEVEVEVEAATLTLSWPAAADDVGVVSYSVLRGADEVASLDPATRRHPLRFEPGESREVEVVARDAAGHATQLSASARVRVAIAQREVEQMLLGASENDRGLDGFLAGGVVTGNAEEILAGASGVGIARGRSNERAGGDVTVRARLELGPVERESGPGVLEDAVVTRMLRRHVGAMHLCHERALRAEPAIAGSVRFRFTIAPSGSVSVASLVENTTRSVTLGSCVTRVVSHLRFAPGPADGFVTYVSSLTFAPDA